MNRERYTWAKFVNALRNPELFVGELRRLPLAVNGRYYDELVHEPPTDVMEEDWDNLLILDGCRLDTFAEENTIEGALETRISHGSASGEFLAGNFEGKQFHDTVYVTANPWVHTIADDTFHRIVDVINRDDCWDPELRTVRPGTLVEETRAVLDEIDDKRVIVHFMQPHYPFIGETGRNLGFGRGIYGDRHEDYEIGTDVWSELRRRGPKAHDAVERAYRENLRLALPHVQELIDLLGGKTVVSADHGNMLGERLWPVPVRGYGHPAGIHVPQLVRVPWHVVESGSRRDVTADPPIGRESPDEATVEERLVDLGYR